MNSTDADITLQDFITRFQLQLPGLPVRLSHQRQAAVLIPIVCHPQPTLLLTERAKTLRKHAGQVAFPGGAADPGDASLIMTALREAHEEVALPPTEVTVLGTLPPVDSSSGFRVTPVVGLVAPGLQLDANRQEVDQIFEIPLHAAMQLSNYSVLDIQHRSRNLRVYFSWYQQHMVWGMTAQILYRLGQQIRRSG